MLDWKAVLEVILGSKTCCCINWRDLNHSTPWELKSSCSLTFSAKIWVLFEFPTRSFHKISLMTRIVLQHRVERSPLSADIKQFQLFKSLSRDVFRRVPASLSTMRSLNTDSYKDDLPGLIHFLTEYSSKIWIGEMSYVSQSLTLTTLTFA